MELDQPMECSDPDINERLPDYHDGRLPQSLSGVIALHLQSCRACQRTLSLIGLLSENLPQDDTIVSGDHISRAVLIHYYENPAHHTAEQVADIERHLAGCAGCRSELQFLNAMETDLHAAHRLLAQSGDNQKTFGGVIRNILWRPAVAYGLLSLALIPAIKWLVGSPPPQTRSNSIWPAFPVKLREVIRSQDSIADVPRSAPSSLILLDVPYYHFIAAKRYSFIIRSKVGEGIPIPLMADFSEAEHIRVIADFSSLTDGQWQLCLDEIDRANPNDIAQTCYSFRLFTK